MRILTDAEFLTMASDKPQELNDAMIELRNEGRVQFFDDGSGDVLITLLERTN